MTTDWLMSCLYCAQVDQMGDVIILASGYADGSGQSFPAAYRNISFASALMYRVSWSRIRCETPGAEGVVELQRGVADHIGLLVFHGQTKLVRIFKAVPAVPQRLLLP